MKSGDPHCNEELAVELARRDGEEGRRGGAEGEGGERQLIK